MRKGSDLIGKTIIAFDTGKRLCRVQDLVFDQENNQLLALLVDEGGLFSSARVLPLQDVQAIGTDAIIAPSRGAIQSANRFPQIKRILDYNNVLKGTHIMTVDGRHLGRMVDLYFDEESGAVEGYEVSGGLFADAYTGRSFVPAPHTIRIGDEVAFVPSEVADMMEEQVGGIKAAMQTAGEQIQTAAQTTSDRLQVASAQANQRLQEAGRAASASLTNSIISPEEQKAFVVGKTVTYDVRTADGLVVFPTGQVATAEDANFAENQGLLEQLYRATGGDVGQLLGERLQTTRQQAGERLRLAQRGALSSVTNAIISPEEQKTTTVGKVSQRIVTAPDGTVLVVAGQQITPAIAGAAEYWGMLDELYRAAGGRMTDVVSQRTNALVASRYVEQAMGHRVRQTVRTRDGLVIAAPGQIVTDRVIEHAKHYHREAELLDAVGLSPQEAMRGRTQTTLTRTSDRFNSSTQNFGERMREEVAELQTEARTFWQNLRGSASNIQEQSARKLEEQRIKGALGRPVTRVILDEFDNVILNVGELITHRAIEEAREAGVLDVLLNSVYTQPPQFTKEEMRAPGIGDASLQHEANQY